MLVLDAVELLRRAGVARAGLAADALAPGDQLGRAVVAPAGDPVEPFGKRLLDARPLLVDEAGERFAVDPGTGRVGQAARHAGQGHAAGRHVGGAAQQQKVLERAGFDGAVCVLAQPDQAVLDGLGRR